MSEWSVVYKKAIQDDGTLLFPERLDRKFLENARRTMGSYLFANQYQNEVVPDDERRFKPEWLRTFTETPSNKYSFGFIDPAIGQKDHHDYTAIVIVDVDSEGTWYVRVANRYRLTPTQIVDKMFAISSQFNLKGLGVETVAYQEAILDILGQEMRKRTSILPVTGIKRSAVSKETRILKLVPRFEWGRIFVSPQLKDFEDEYSMFPRGSHDDLLDALASLEEIVHYPQKKEIQIERPNGPNHPDYERWYIQQLTKGKTTEIPNPFSDGDSDYYD